MLLGSQKILIRNCIIMAGMVCPTCSLILPVIFIGGLFVSLIIISYKQINIIQFIVNVVKYDNVYGKVSY